MRAERDRAGVRLAMSAGQRAIAARSGVSRLHFTLINQSENVLKGGPLARAGLLTK